MFTDYAPANIYANSEIPTSFLCPAISAIRTISVEWVSDVEYVCTQTTVIKFECKDDVVLAYSQNGIVRSGYLTPQNESLVDYALLDYCWRDVPSGIYAENIYHLLCLIRERARQYRDIQAAASDACLENRLNQAKKIAKSGNNLEAIKAVACALGMPEYEYGMQEVSIYKLPHIEGYQAMAFSKSPVSCGKTFSAIAKHLINKAADYANPSRPLALRLELQA